jgi:hypothetical protein
MRVGLQTVTLAGVVALARWLGAGARDAKAQLFVSTPRVTVGVGAPMVGLYPGYPVYPAYPPVVGLYPVRPYPYVYGGFYRPRPYGPYYGPRYYGYRRW